MSGWVGMAEVSVHPAEVAVGRRGSGEYNGYTVTAQFFP